MMWKPSRESALKALESFLPRAGRSYAAKRNYDLGPADRSNVSALSPWIRCRVIHESEVVAATLRQHSRTEAEKFIEEVCWRTYWKGWLHLRPSIWSDYVSAWEQCSSDYGSNELYKKAITGHTGIECFDCWSRELLESGYLHNHTRMWYASIWVHTLKLPWQLGAGFFLKHLLDGDAASNTLSWRWVGGLHTTGKTYLARADNIRKYTCDRFSPGNTLAQNPKEPDAPIQIPAAEAFEHLSFEDMKPSSGLLLTDDNASPSLLRSEGMSASFTSIAGLIPSASYKALEISERVYTFRKQLLEDSLSAYANSHGCFDTTEAVVCWAVANQLEVVMIPEPARGIWDTVLPQLKDHLEAAGISLVCYQEPWDQFFYPLATKGFFRFKKAIPKALDSLLESGQVRQTLLDI